MKADEELREARAQEARVRAAIVKLAAEVRPVLGEDLARFPEYEVRRRFVADPTFAGNLDDATVASLKAEIARRGPEVAARVVAGMEDPELWLAGVEESGPGKSFAENRRLWAATDEIVALVRELLRTFRFPGHEAAEVEYRMPMRFIERKYLPGLAEKYWSLIADLRDARARVASLEGERVRESLGRRWDKL